MTDTTTEVATTEDMTAEEGQRLLELERKVEQAMRSAGKIAGEALREIRDKRLYRASHPSFERYVLERHGLSKSAAYRMIEPAPTNGISPAAAAIGQASAKAAERRHITLDQPPTTIDPQPEELAPKPAPQRPEKPKEERVAPTLPQGRLTPAPPLQLPTAVRTGAGRPPGEERTKKTLHRDYLNRILAVLDHADPIELAKVSTKAERTRVKAFFIAMDNEDKRHQKVEAVADPKHCDHPVNRAIGKGCGKCGAPNVHKGG